MLDTSPRLLSKAQSQLLGEAQARDWDTKKIVRRDNILLTTEFFTVIELIQLNIPYLCCL